ncbi:MAG: hypothetical protein JOY78_14435 [Pseudonocardia sp.]|nr:hypothetical protein [Pseudonocardia sp.]
MQEQTTSLAENFDATSENLGSFEPGLRDIWAHMQEAMGDSHGDDVPQLGEVVEESIQGVNECANTLAECAQKAREIERRL